MKWFASLLLVMLCLLAFASESEACRRRARVVRERQVVVREVVRVRVFQRSAACASCSSPAAPVKVTPKK